jgi:signal transduction histidine kinase
MKLRDNPIEFDDQIDSNEPEIMVQLIDISQKIFMDQLSMERQQMALMNSTVSHEMRNPLNSLQV